MMNDPTKPATLESVLDIAENGFATLEFSTGDKVLMDGSTANAIKAVYNALSSPELKAKAARMIENPVGLYSLVEFAWKNVKFKN